MDSGADAIVCPHTHCISGSEVYKNAPIIYTLGDFLFTMSSVCKEWYQGLLGNLQITKAGPIEFELLPIEQDSKAFSISLSAGNNRSSSNNMIGDLSAIISSSNQLDESWQIFGGERKAGYKNYLCSLSGFENRYVRAVVDRLKLNSIFGNRNQAEIMLNLLRCEAHKDVLEASLNNKRTN